MSNIPTLASVALAITGLALIHETRLRSAAYNVLCRLIRYLRRNSEAHDRARAANSDGQKACQATVPTEAVVKSERTCMPRSSPDSGVMGILGGLVGVSLLMSLMYGDMAQWIPVALVVIVTLKAVRRTRR